MNKFTLIWMGKGQTALNGYLTNSYKLRNYNSPDEWEVAKGSVSVVFRDQRITTITKEI